MYSQFFIASQLPNIDHALGLQKCLVIGNYLMLTSFLVVASCIFITFAYDQYFTIPAQISAHIATIVFAALLKIGYVLRCIALHGFGKRNF
ncbi:hypothetical protein [Colwellia piezophila]|uniref:hypothetical protein n=1 Tax=Colwellia piezophila TaxID=211668 RepID=UPI00036DBEF6|nr:hypothetical protein [Colwellia piezophila]